MAKSLISKTVILIETNAEKLWSVLTVSKYTKEYMFNCTVSSDWKQGDSIVWEGNFQGYEAYQKGEILEIQKNSLIKYSTFDPNFGLEDKAENYIHVTYIINENRENCELTIINETFDGNEERMNHISAGWASVTENLKASAEKIR